jgi:hypothetical protein
MCRPRTERRTRTIAVALASAITLAGCSDPGLYLDRRDSIALSAGDAVAANMAVQTIDPWPAHSGNTNLAANGQRMQSAIERYRTNLITPPIDPMMLQTANPSPTTASTTSTQSGAQGGAPASSSTTSATTTTTSASGQ